jgi:WD40 repeat protein
MRTKAILFRCLLGGIAGCLVQPWTAAVIAESRTWTYTVPESGESRVEAEYAGLQGLLVNLTTKDGKTVQLPLADLGPEDKQYVDKIGRAETSEFHAWTGARGDKFEARYVVISERMVVLETRDKAVTQIPWLRLSEADRAYVVQTQRTVETARTQAAQVQTQWNRVVDGVEGITLNPGDLPNRSRQVADLLFSPRGDMLLSFCDYSGEKPVIWDLRKSKKQCVLQDTVNFLPRNSATCCFHPSGKELWAWFDSSPSFLGRWDVVTGRCIVGADNRNSPWSQKIRQAVDSRRINSIRFSSDGGLLVLGADQYGRVNSKVDAVLLDSTTFEVQEALVGGGGQGDQPRSTKSVFVSADSNLVAAGKDGLGCYVWNLKTRKQGKIVDEGALVQLVDKGTLVAMRHYEKMTIHATATGALERTLEVQNGKSGDRSPSCVAVSPVGTLFAASFQGGRIDLRDWRTGETLAELPGHRSTVRTMVFSADGKLLASGDEGGIIRVWKVAGLKPATAARPSGPAEGPAPAPSDTNTDAEGEQSLSRNKTNGLQADSAQTATQIEAESLLFNKLGQYRPEVQEMNLWQADRWSGRKQVFARGCTMNDSLILTLPVRQAGTYRMELRITRAPDYGNVQVSIDGQALGRPYVGYS